MNESSAIARTAVACLAGLAVLNLVMLASLLAGVEPHPPPVLGPLGGAGPFIGANLSLSAVAALLCAWRYRAGHVVALVVVLLNAVTFGPHKYVSGDAALVHPAVTVGTVLSIVLLVAAIAGLREVRR